MQAIMAYDEKKFFEGVKLGEDKIVEGDMFVVGGGRKNNVGEIR